MPSKQRVLEDIEKIDKVSVSVAMLKHFVNSVSLETEPPSYFKKGDVYISIGGSKFRPNVIIKVCGDMVYSIPLSTTLDELTLCQSRSRFFKDGFFTKSIQASTVKYVSEHFAGTYDNPKLLNKAIKLLKQEINTI